MMRGTYGRAPGTQALDVGDRLRERHRRCRPALALLRLLAETADERTSGDLRAATAVVLMELESAERILLESVAASVRREAIAHLLSCRVNRLTIVAEDAFAAAEAGEAPALRRLLYQFQALAVALWKVQLGVRIPQPRQPARVGDVSGAVGTVSRGPSALPRGYAGWWAGGVAGRCEHADQTE